MSNSIEELLKNMKTTSACRFNAAKRLETREQDLTRLTGFTSSYVIFLTVLPYFLHLGPNSTDNLNLLTVLFAIIILVASLLQYSAKNGVNAEQHHRCALEIAQIRREMKIFSDTADEKKIQEYTNKYNHILDRYSINHDSIDYCQCKMDRPEEFPWLKRHDWSWIYIKLIASKQSINAALATITLVLIFITYKVGFIPWSLRLNS